MYCSRFRSATEWTVSTHTVLYVAVAVAVPVTVTVAVAVAVASKI